MLTACAKDVSAGRITTAKGIQDALLNQLPTDAEFEAAVSVARVSKASIARYYLRAMESEQANGEDPELVPNENEDERLGNLVLLRAADNHAMKNDYKSKAAVFKESAYALTKMAGKSQSWGPKEIAERQKKLAAIAIKTWPLAIR
jgi:hypothetical protein